MLRPRYVISGTILNRASAAKRLGHDCCNSARAAMIRCANSCDRSRDDLSGMGRSQDLSASKQDVAESRKAKSLFTAERWQSRRSPPKEKGIPHRTSSKSDQGAWSQTVASVFVGSSMVATLFRAESEDRPTLSRKCVQKISVTPFPACGALRTTHPFRRFGHNRPSERDLEEPICGLSKGLAGTRVE